MKKSPWVWVVVAIGGSCALCGMSALGLMALGLMAEDGPVSGAPPRSVARGPSLPTGETPDLFPGMPGWLPSGRGVPMPEPEVVGGRPVGLWYSAYSQPSGGMQAVHTLFLEDGTVATNPRPGGGTLFDLEGQRAQRGVTGLSTFDDSEGFDSGEDASGPWFTLGKQRFRALTFATDDAIVGTWLGSGSRYVFRADGTYESGTITSTGEWVLAAHAHGTWVLDGYLIQVRPSDALPWINRVAFSGPDFMALGSVLHQRQ